MTTRPEVPTAGASRANQTAASIDARRAYQPGPLPKMTLATRRRRHQGPTTGILNSLQRAITMQRRMVESLRAPRAGVFFTCLAAPAPRLVFAHA